MIQFDRQIVLRVIGILRHLNTVYRLLILHSPNRVAICVGTAIPNKLRTMTRKCESGSELTIPPLLPIKPTGFILT